MRLIDADNLQFDWCGSEMCGKPCDNCNKRTISKEDVDNAHTIEERPQGEWIDYSADEGYVECSFCHELTNCEGNIEELHYCWNCGAEMRKEEEE